MNLNKKINFNIVLCGFMGCGKTTVGKHLAKRTEIDFVDTDSLIENAVGLKISEIFEIYGEKYFRSLEKNCIKTVSRLSKTVISVGGGTILNQSNIFNLKRYGKIFFLDIPVSVLAQRLKTDSSRPLIQNKCSIKELFDKRSQAYFHAADFIINANQSVDKICKDILDNINKTTPN